MTHKALIYLQGWDSKQQGIFFSNCCVFLVSRKCISNNFPFFRCMAQCKARSIRKCINKVRTLKSAVYICSKNIQTPLNDYQHISW